MQAPFVVPKRDSYTFDYPELLWFEQTQKEIHWWDFEVEVGNDLQNLLVDLTVQEKHAVMTALRLFTLMEMILGGDFWRDFVPKYFPIPEVERVAAMFSHMELNIHAPFYAKINQLLMIDTDDFYRSYLDDPQLKDRIAFINESLKGDPLVALGTFVFMEGAILFASFAFFKHFQNNGKNKLNSIASGINFSARDEQLHSDFAAELFKIAAKTYEPEQLKQVIRQIECNAEIVFEHEGLIIDKFFELGPINGLNKEDMLAFIKGQLNQCLTNMDLHKFFIDASDNPIAEWFDVSKKLNQFHDFFNRVGNSYTRKWVKSRFVWDNSFNPDEV